jgi:hypothetical protein
MRIDPKDNIAGIPILKIRDFLHKERSFSWPSEFIATSLKIDDTKVDVLIKKLVQRGYIESDGVRHEEEYWKITQNGITFANATAAKPITKKTAEKVFSEFMERVKSANDNPYYLYKVTSVVLFGSYLSDNPRISDIDVAIKT